MMELRTGYDWCLLERLRPLKLSQWPTDWPFYVDSFFEEKITYEDFFKRIKQCEYKSNSTPRKTDMFLIYRMYGLVPYNLSPIQQAIQYAHAVVEYQQNTKGISPFELQYDKWARKDKTMIILNGGTTNENPERYGTVQKYTQMLKDNGIMIAEFREPDLNDTQTAVAFLVDERVFDRELYPDFVRDENSSDEENDKQYKNWLEKIGGEKNLFLRSFLPAFRLA